MPEETEPLAGAADSVGGGEPFPAATDAHWDELTADTLAYLHRVRRTHRRQRRGSIVFWLYAALLILGFYGFTFGRYAIEAVSTGQPSGAVAPQVLAALSVGSPAIFGLVLLAAVRDATWRGPIGVDTAAAAWLLPLPIRWGRLLRPRLWRAVGGAAAVGAGTGAACGLVLSMRGLGTPGATIVAGLAAGVAIAVLATAAGALVERFGAAAGVRRWTLPLWLFPVACAVAAVPAGMGYQLGWARRALLWSGPWGWAAQPLVAAVGGSVPGWPFATALLAATTVLALFAADRAARGLAGSTVRARARAVGGVTDAMRALQPRRARLAMRSAQGPKTPHRLRLPPPRSRFWLLPWRDVTALLRNSARLGWCLLWMASAHLLAMLAAITGGVAVVLLSVIAAYLAAAQLVEPARLDADDTRRSALLPYRYASLALAHAAVPVVLLVIGNMLAVGLSALAGAPVLPGLLVLTAAPCLVGAALVGAYRGELPQRLLVRLHTGMDTPLGDPTPVAVVVWYSRGLLAALVLLTPALHRALHPTAELAGAFATTAPWLAAAAALLLIWARGQAAKRYRA